MMAYLWRRGLLLGLLAVCLGALVACGGDGSAGGAAFSDEIAAQRVAVAADPGGALRWDRPSYEAQAGDITFVVSNASPTAHQFTLAGNGVNYRSKYLQRRTTQNLTVKALPSGEYQIICDYPGHKAARMIAKLTVR